MSVQMTFVQQFADGTWEEVAVGDPWDDFTPSHWMPLPKYPIAAEGFKS